MEGRVADQPKDDHRTDDESTGDELTGSGKRRRDFLKAGGAVALAGSLAAPAIAKAQTPDLKPRQIPLLPGRVPFADMPTLPGKVSHWYIPASDKTVHWGYFSKKLKPLIEINSGDYVTIECLTHQAGDDPERMIKGDPGAESVYYWTKDKKNVNRRGIGPMNAPNGAGGGQGVHIMTGPVFVHGAEPGDILEVRILDMYPRPCANPDYKGSTFGTNLAAHWGYQYHDLLKNPKPREVVTIYEFDAASGRNWARPLYNYKWGPFTDPFGVLHTIYDYPGLVVNPNDYHPKHGIMKNVRVPMRPHFGNMGLAPTEVDMANSIPPEYVGGNVDDWRMGKGTTMYYPVSVDGANFSVGDTHAAMGDSELCGTAIESSWTGVFQFILHKQNDITEGTLLSHVNYPLLETKDEWVVHGFSYPDYLKALGPHVMRTPPPGAGEGAGEAAGAGLIGPELLLKQSLVKNVSLLDLAMRDAFHKMRSFLMHSQQLSEDEANSLMSVAVDFGVTQVVDRNWGVHAILKKEIFAGRNV